MANPLFPTLMPRVVDRLWFSVDKPCDDSEQQTQLESEYNSWLHSIGSKDSHVTPIGKSQEMDDEEEEDEDDEGEDDEESDTNDDELDTDMMDDRDSADDTSNY